MVAVPSIYVTEAFYSFVVRNGNSVQFFSRETQGTSFSANRMMSLSFEKMFQHICETVVVILRRISFTVNNCWKYAKVYFKDQPAQKNIISVGLCACASQVYPNAMYTYTAVLLVLSVLKEISHCLPNLCYIVHKWSACNKKYTILSTISYFMMYFIKVKCLHLQRYLATTDRG